MSNPSLRDLVADLGASAGALAVLGAELRARTLGVRVDPKVRPHVDDVLRAIGAYAAIEAATPEELRALAAEIRHLWVVDAELLSAPDRAPGWTYADEDVLSSGGEATEGFAGALARIAPELDGLAARLDAPDGSFLDVGTGVGRLSIALARRWTSLRIVGIDTWRPSLALARANVAAAGLEDRIELREQRAEDLPDEAAFDLAWIPAPFIPPDALGRVVARVHRALRPGGWLLFATSKPGADLRAALMRLRVASWGGEPLADGEAERIVEAAGFGSVRPLPGPPRDFKMIVAGRRA